MSGVPKLPHWWNRVAAKTKRKEAFILKMNFVKFTVVFYILFMWIGVTNATEVPSKKEEFELLEFDANSKNTDSQSLQFCIQEMLAISGWQEKINPNVSIYETLPILCEAEQNETRYRIGGSRWIISNLTYKITSYPCRTAILGGYANIDREIKKAFTLWESVSDFRFTASKDLFESDINIRFLSGDHADDPNFINLDAHALYPAYGGDIHFNDDKEWTIGNTSGADIFQIAVHELGHALGLGHYQRNGSVMCTAVCNTHVYRSNFTLHSDDIKAIKLLYGNVRTRLPVPFPVWFFEKGLTTHSKQDHKSVLCHPITWAVIAVACIIIGVVVAVGVTQIIRCGKQVSERYWAKVEFGIYF